MDATAAALLAMARQIRSRTLMTLERAEPQWLTWTPHGTANHMTWHAGHALWVVDVLCITPLGGQSELPAGWAQRFGQDSHPARDTSPWPTRDELLAHLAYQLQRIESLLATADESTFGEMNPRGGAKGGLGWRIIHGLHDEAIHQGEMALLLKLCRAGHAD